MKVLIAFLFGAALLGDAMGRDLYNVFKANNLHPPNPRIINGKEAVPHSIPYHAFLTFRDSIMGIFKWSCSGVLISENYVVTAGHCITTGAGSVEVVLGAHSLKNSEDTKQNYTSTEFITHPDFNFSNVWNDIGLIKLPHAASLNSAVNVIALSTLSDPELVGKTANVSGWGLTSIYAEELADKLRVVNVTIVDDSMCKIWKPFRSDQQICSKGPDDHSPCNGDSGAPLTVDGKLVGLVSYGASDCSTDTAPDVYTRVSKYLEWIESNTDVHIA